MADKNLNQRLIIIGIVVLVGAWLLRNPSESLKPGLDIAGGVSMLFEIDTSGVADPSGIAEEMKTLLQRRVDPQGVYGLAWRVHGSNRIEVQMPLPPKEAQARREAYVAALEKLGKAGIGRQALEDALALSGPARSAALEKLSRAPVPPAEGASDELRAQVAKIEAKRLELLQGAAAAEDEYQRSLANVNAETASQPATTQTAIGDPLAAAKRALRDAVEAREDAIDAVLSTNLDMARFQDILELQQGTEVRENSLKDLLTNLHADLAPLIRDVVEKHRIWRSGKSFLDGPADLQRLLKGAGVLEFRILADAATDNPTRYDRFRKQLVERGAGIVPGDEFGWFKVDSPMQFFDFKSPEDLRRFDATYRSHNRLVVGKRDEKSPEFYVLAKTNPEFGLLHTPGGRKWSLSSVFVSRDEHGRLQVNFELDVVGGGMFEELTRKNIDKPLCILVDNIAYSAPNIQSKIGRSGRITGDFSQEKISYLVQTMQAGALPARLRDTPVSERVIGSSLGETNRNMAIRAGLIGSAGVLLVMAIYYHWCGLVANVAMLMNVGLTLAAMSLLQARFTLDGIAGIILAVGMCVDANVLIYERMREEKLRGASLRMMLKNGFDKAFVTIFDSNITTLLTCAIIYYVGSEEIKGFGLTLGWGIALNMFTSVFVTRTLLTLLVKYGVVKDIGMLSLIHVPNIDWYARRKLFITLSLIVTLGGLGLTFLRGSDSLDVEFRGGVSAEIECKSSALKDTDIGRKLRTAGEAISRDAAALAQAAVAPVPGQTNVFQVGAPGVKPEELEAFLYEPLEEAGLIVRGGVERRVGEEGVTVTLRGEATGEALTSALKALAGPDRLPKSGRDIADASVNSVLETGEDATKGRTWSVTTTETNKRLVQYALQEALGDELVKQARISFELRGDNGRPYPITDRRLELCVPGLPPGVGTSVADYLGGAAMYFDKLDPPQATETLRTRLRNMRLQPGFQDLPWREFAVIGVQPTGGHDESGAPLYTSAVVAIADRDHRYQDDPLKWWSGFAQRELDLASAALQTEQSLRKVSQFKPQIAGQSQQQAIVALILSWAMIIVYVWIRFGRPVYGLAGVVALVHDVLVALAFVAISGWIGGEHIGNLLLIENFKINMPIIAALLTIIGFSINDTIVIFDRVREVRGRLGVVTPEVVNRAINECMSRTVLTTGTVLIVLLCAYIFGGSGIRGFNYCMLIGAFSGVYSTIAIAGPLLVLQFGERRAAARAPATR